MILKAKKQPKNLTFSTVNERFFLKLSAIGTLSSGMGIYHLEGANNTFSKLSAIISFTICPQNHS